MGYLTDHMVISGFRITPAVGLVRPDFSLALILVIMVAREHLGARGDPCAP